MAIERSQQSKPKQTTTARDPFAAFRQRPFGKSDDSSAREEAGSAGSHDFAKIPLASGIQAKLTVGEPNDQYEQEADQVAAQVVQQINAPQPQAVQRQDLFGEEDDESTGLQLKPLSDSIRRKLPEEDQELQEKPLVQRQVDSDGSVSADLESSIETARGQGKPLSDGIRGSMEQAFGADFGGVRVHTDSRSDQLNRSVQARAFTTGQDVFFRQGEYQPDSPSGQELLAHELTHVVQQGGGKLMRSALKSKNHAHRSKQNVQRTYSEISASVQNKPELQRDGPESTTASSDETATWVASTMAAVEQVQDAVPEAVNRLNEDAETAIDHIRTAQATYDDFDEKYERAVVAFVSGVEAAQAQEQEFRENVKFVATSLLAVQAPLAYEMYSKIDDVLSKVQRISSIANSANDRRQNRANPPHSNSPAMAARSENRVDWSELLSTTLTAFEDTLRHNSTLNGINRSCTEIIRFLHDVDTGRYDGDSPRTSSLGTRATQISNNVDDIIEKLAEIDSGTVSDQTERLSARISERLDGITERRLQQDIAIRWIAGLTSSSDRDEIDTADAYLKEIGVIDAANNRLGYDTGAITTSDDESIIHWRADWENTAMNLVGTTVTWLGPIPGLPIPAPIDDGTRCIEPRVYSGRVRDGRNREWTVNVPEGAPPEGGGSMLLVSYDIDHRDSSGWEWSRPWDLRQQLQWEVSFTARPVSRLGGGAPRPGPVMHAAN